MTPHLPEGLTYAALGMGVLGIILTMFYSWSKRVRGRDTAEAGLDQRAAAMVEVVSKPFRDLIERLNANVAEERIDRHRAEERADKAQQELVTFMERSQNLHSVELQKVREQGETATRRMHERVDAIDMDHRGCRADLVVANKRIDQLEKYDRERLRDASPHGERVTVVQMPVPMPQVPVQS